MKDNGPKNKCNVTDRCLTALLPARVANCRPKTDNPCDQ